MRSLTILAVISMPFLGACQWWPHFASETPQKPEQRLQGELLQQNNRLWLRTCGTETPPKALRLDSAATAFLQALRLNGVEGTALFVDLSAMPAENATTPLQVSRFYQVSQKKTCPAPDFKRLTLQANGHSPEWHMKIMPQGFLLERANQPPLALPYIEEQLGNSRYEFSSEANGKRIRLSIAPELCTDSQTVSGYPLRARLSIDNEPLRMGCASFGGARNE